MKSLALITIIPFFFALAVQPAAQQAESDSKNSGGSQPATSAAEQSIASESICLMVESAAAANGLPVEFFARVIWQESRFRPAAVGPVTRSGDRARGIAQFMPRTAAERGLLDPFDPIQALPKSAEFLNELRAQFGNLGLAAAAYNAGPGRVRDWMSGASGLPAETRNYVQAITGRSAEEWKEIGRTADLKIAARSGCGELIALLKHAPNFFVEQLEKRVREGVVSPWGAQLSAGFSRTQVLSAYAAIEKKYRSVLAGFDAAIFRGKFRSRGTSDFYQVRVGAATRAEADKICVRLKTAGAACMVLRNARGQAEPI